MLACVALAVAGAAAVTGVSAPAGAVEVAGVGTYLPTPVGYVRSECVREVPNGVHIEELEQHMLLTHADGSKSTMEYCDTAGGTRPVFLEHAVGGPHGLPADYDGCAGVCVCGRAAVYSAPKWAVIIA